MTFGAGMSTSAGITDNAIGVMCKGVELLPT